MRAAGLVVAVLSVFSLSAAPASAEPKLLGQWPLEGAYEDGASSGTADASGNGLDLKAPVGTIRIGKPGKFGSAGLLPANASSLKVDSPVLAPAQVTLLAWVKQNGAAPLLRYIAGRGDDGPGTCNGSSYALYTGFAGFGGLHFYVRTVGAGSPGVVTPVIPDAAWTDNQWHLIAGTFDGTKARLYIDGNLAATSVASAAAPIEYSLGGGTTFYADNYPQAPCGLSDFPGAIDELRVYDAALSGSELGRLAGAAGPAAPELISDASLIKALPPTPAPAPTAAPTPAPNPKAEAALAAASKGAKEESLKSASASVEGVSKLAPVPAVQQELAEAQKATIDQMAKGAIKSAVGPLEASLLEAADAKRLRPSSALRNRLDSYEYGIPLEVPAESAGQAVLVGVTLLLEKKQGSRKGDAKVVTQQINLPPTAGIASAKGATRIPTASVVVPVDKAAQAAMAQPDVARASLAVQATLSSLSDLSAENQQRLQTYMDTRAKAIAAVSNILKKKQEVEQSIAANIRGGGASRKSFADLKAKNEQLAKEAQKLEQQMNEASQKAVELTNGAMKQLLEALTSGAVSVGVAPQAGVPDIGVAVGGTGKLPTVYTPIPMSTASVKGCGSNCKYALLSAAAASGKNGQKAKSAARSPSSASQSPASGPSEPAAK